VSWIRIDFGRLDPEGQKKKKEKSEEIPFFEVPDVLL
jgi:hypothetical protein